MRGRLLIVDDDRVFRITTAALLEAEGHEVTQASDAQEAVDALARDRFDLVLLDLRMPGLDGISLVEVLRTRGEGVPILMISGFATVDAAVKALHTGADDFLTKPVEPDVLLGRVDGLLTARPTGSGGPGLGGIVTRSASMLLVLEEVERVAPTEATVLVTGETGTGKELVARAIHEASDRVDGPFLAINCGALSEGLLESELFGHVRGAFTGAVRDKQGLFLAANGGTLFLDEVGDVTPATQQRLLRALEEREFLPVGSVRPVRTDVRVVTATNRDLAAAVERGDFREDLYYRLNVFHIQLPPLRERKGDIPLLVEHFFRSRSESGGARAAGPHVSPLAMRTLLAYAWPGNVRQLFSVLESATVRSGWSAIHAQHLPPEVLPQGTDGPDSGRERYRAGGAGIEREAIVQALRQADGVRARAAQLLGMGRTTLWRKMKEHGLDD